MRQQAAVARYNNPHINPVMATPPAVAITGTAPVAPYTNAITWGSARQDAINYYGGPRATQIGLRTFLPSTISSAPGGEVWRVQTIVDSAHFYIGVFDVATAGAYRLIVDGQYTTLTPFGLGASGYAYISVDFSAAGGRAVRNIVLEGSGGAVSFGGFYVQPTEGVYKPRGPVLRAALVGDSYTAMGATSVFDCFGSIMCDFLGIADYWNLGVPGTGLLANGSGSQLTARGRLSDLVNAAPDVIFLANGHNDNASSASAVQTEMAAYLAAIRAALPLPPVFVFGVMSGNVNSDTSMATTETAIAAAVTAFADSHVYFVPVTTDPNGRWMTGTGNVTTPTGDGNADVYVSADNVHPSQAAHWFLTDRFDAAVTRILQAAH